MATTTRRRALAAGGAAAAGAALLGRPLFSAGPAAAVEPPPTDAAAQVLGRATYGPLPEELARARSIGVEAWLDEQLDPDAVDDSAVEGFLAANLPTLTMPLAAMVAAARDDPEARFQPLRELQAATIYRAVHSRRQLYQVMVELWSDHFSVFALDGPLTVLKPYEDREVIRRHALGTFRDLLQADARSPAMLYSLDNVSNVAAGPNENYARELLELHTLGVDGGYTEQDVQEAARIFTGWSIDRDTGGFRFYSQRHDYGTKQVLGVHYPAGRGESEGEELLDRLAAHPSTARHIAFKLARRFVADVPPDSVVTRVAGVFEATGGSIPAVLRELLLSPELLDAVGAKLKRPFDYVVSVLRTTGAIVTQDGYRELYELLRRLGQVPFGWPAPDGYPATAAYWTATSTLLTRWNFALGLADGTYDRVVQVPIGGLVTGVSTAAEVVDGIADRVLGRGLAPGDRDAVLAAAAPGRDPDQPLPIGVRAEVGRVALGLILVSRDFQLR